MLIRIVKENAVFCGALLTDNLIPLVYVIGTGEKHPSSDHLTHDAPHTPDVHVLRIAHAEDDLGSSVVPCNHVGRHHEGRARCPGQPKVQYLQGAVRLHHNVAGLQVLEKTNYRYNLA